MLYAICYLCVFCLCVSPPFLCPQIHVYLCICTSLSASLILPLFVLHCMALQCTIMAEKVNSHSVATWLYLDVIWCPLAISKYFVSKTRYIFGYFFLVFILFFGFLEKKLRNPCSYYFALLSYTGPLWCSSLWWCLALWINHFLNSFLFTMLHSVVIGHKIWLFHFNSWVSCFTDMLILRL